MDDKQEVLFEPEQAHARHTDPETSHKAAQSVVNLGKTRDLILKILKEHGPSTDERIYDIYSTMSRVHWVSPSGMRTRRIELVRLGKVKEAGILLATKSNRLAIVWQVV